MKISLISGNRFLRKAKWASHFLAVGAVLVLLASCIPDPLEVEGLPVVKPQIVVSTQIIPDQSLVVLLTKTFDALQASEDSDPQEVINQIAVNDAVVTITGPTGTDTLIFLSSGFYGGVSIPFEAEEAYTLHVKSESLGEVSATTTVKPQVTFDTLSAMLYFNGYDDSLAQVTYRFNDPPGSNWYLLTTQQFERDELTENILNPNAYTRLVSDQEFSGHVYGEVFRTFPRDFQTGDTIIVSLASISEEYYNFVKLRRDNRFSFVEYLSEPINYPSNVNGGKGYFNLYIPDIRLLTLE